MDLLPDIIPNYYMILQNIDKFKWEDLILDDSDIYQLFSEIYFTIVTADLPQRPDYTDLEVYGENYIKSLMVGSGSYGQIFSFKDKLIKFYESSRGGWDSTKGPVKIIREKDKTILENNLNENVCGMYFNKIIEDYSPCRYDIYGAYIMMGKKEFLSNTLWEDFLQIGTYDKYHGDFIVSMMEKLTTISNSSFGNNMYYILYVVLHNIYIGQTLSKFLHGDLHIGNIMCKEYKEKTIRLSYVDEIIEIKNTYDFIPIIIDFGFSSFTENNVRYSSVDEPITVSGTSFDTYFDSTKLFSSVISFCKHFKIDTSEIEDIFLENKAPNIDEYLYEPEIYRIDYIYNKYKPRFITDILRRLLDKLDHRIIKTSTLLPKLIDTYADVIHFTGNRFIINSFIMYKNLKYESKVIPHFTEAKYSKVLNVHMLIIDGYTNSHRFVTKCCKRNVYDFIADGGIAAINGSYFDLNTADDLFKPTYAIVRHRQNLSKYKDDYGYLNIINGYFSISEDSKQLEHEITSGPLLFLDGTRTNLEERIFDIKNKTYKYSCTNKNKIDIDYDKKFVECNNIYPGELYHIGNPNPRTILATKGKRTYFIVIEGRSDEYRGATIEQMYDLLSFLKVDDAINLDGGASSRMMWKYGNNIYTPQKNIATKTVGSIIGII